jgi:hypothetical protein
MSLPKEDPNFTMAELRTAGTAFVEAGKAYWEAMQKAGMHGAVSWLQSTEGSLVIFTRGEYRERLLRNVHEVGPVYHFGSAQDD